MQTRAKTCRKIKALFRGCLDRSPLRLDEHAAALGASVRTLEGWRADRGPCPRKDKLFLLAEHFGEAEFLLAWMGPGWIAAKIDGDDPVADLLSELKKTRGELSLIEEKLRTITARYEGLLDMLRQQKDHLSKRIADEDEARRSP